MTRSRISVSLSLKGERWRVHLRPKTWSQEEKEQEEKRSLKLPLRKKNPRSRRWSKLLKIRKLQSRKGLLVGRVARSPLAPPRRRPSALHQRSLVMLTTRGPTRTDILPRGSEWMSPQKQTMTSKRKRVGRIKRKAARRSSPALPRGEGVPGLPRPPRTPTTARAGRSTG